MPQIINDPSSVKKTNRKSQLNQVNIHMQFSNQYLLVCSKMKKKKKKPGFSAVASDLSIVSYIKDISCTMITGSCTQNTGKIYSKGCTVLNTKMNFSMILS